MRHVHASGKASHPAATETQLRHALTTYLHDYDADVITLTEMGRSGPALLQWANAHDVHLHHPHGSGRAECAIVSRTPFLSKRVKRLSPLTLRTARSAPLYAVTGRVQGGPWFSVTHTPAHTHGLNPWGPTAWATRVYISALHGWRVARLRRHGGVVLAADWNLDLRRVKVRRRLGRPFPGMKWGWHPGQGSTEGGRVIDGVLTDLRIVTPSRTLPAQPGFDHRAVLTVLGD